MALWVYGYVICEHREDGAGDRVSEQAGEAIAGRAFCADGSWGSSPSPGVKVAVCPARLTHLKHLTNGELSEGECIVHSDCLCIAQCI